MYTKRHRLTKKPYTNLTESDISSYSTVVVSTTQFISNIHDSVIRIPTPIPHSVFHHAHVHKNAVSSNAYAINQPPQQTPKKPFAREQTQTCYEIKESLCDH